MPFSIVGRPAISISPIAGLRAKLAGRFRSATVQEQVVGHEGQCLSNVSRYITEKSTPPLTAKDRRVRVPTSLLKYFEKAAMVVVYPTGTNAEAQLSCYSSGD